MPGLTNARCPLCHRPMVRAWIPNRGWVMAHRHGESKICARQQAARILKSNIQWARERFPAWRGTLCRVARAPFSNLWEKPR